MIPTSIGSVQVGSPWLSRQWINSIPGIQVTSGITQNNLTIRAGNNQPSFGGGAGTSSTVAGSTGSGGVSSGNGGWGGGVSWGGGGFTYNL